MTIIEQVKNNKTNALIVGCKCGSIPTYALSRYHILRPGSPYPPFIKGANTLIKVLDSGVFPKESSLYKLLSVYTKKHGRFADLIEWDDKLSPKLPIQLSKQNKQNKH